MHVASRSHVVCGEEEEEEEGEKVSVVVLEKKFYTSHGNRPVGRAGKGHYHEGKKGAQTVGGARCLLISRENEFQRGLCVC